MLLTRPATISDCELLFEWVNDPITRQMAFSSEQINYENHKKWFESKLSCHHSKIYVISDKSNSIGQVRFDKIDPFSYEIDIHLAPKARGKKYSVDMIRMSCIQFIKDCGNLDIVAAIKYNNIASYKAFRKAGFTGSKMKSINECLCFILIKKN